jgi:bifunctional DNase/RNase
MREMLIDSIRVSLMNYQRVVILRVKDTDRYLPIWIGPNEADAIAVKLQDVAVSRPLTHDLLGNVIDTLGAEVNSIVVSDLSNDTFFAKIVLGVNGGSVEIDCRPSDALALAVRSEAPIFVEDAVLDKASVQMDAETGKPIVPEGEGAPKPLREEELKSLSAFSDFVSTLDLDDLGPGGPESGGPQSGDPAPGDPQSGDSGPGDEGKTG